MKVIKLKKDKIQDKMYRVFKLNIMDCLTGSERELYNMISKGKFENADLKEQAKESLKEKIKEFDGVRIISKDKMYYSKNGEEKYQRQIVLFENEILRRCEVADGDVPLVKEIIILRCKSPLMYGILNQILNKGIDIDECRYVFYTSSTGQMKDCEITLLRQDFWDKHKSALLCGLTEEKINEKGGINMGKYFAAKALNLSNSIVPSGYDISIDDVLIVPDFKTTVKDMVNYLDVDTLKIFEKNMEIEIEHMDGAGIFIPGTFPCSCQIRGGWLKGAIFPFDFHEFIYENVSIMQDGITDINMVDAWGEKIDIKEFFSAKIILTDSQFKMRKYYDSMDDYRKCFKESKLSITVNNWSDNPVCNSQVYVSYQPIQTIPRENLTDDALEELASKSVKYINDAKTDVNVALKMMGINDSQELDSYDEERQELSVLQESIKIYPQLLKDIHVRKVFQSALESERRKAQGGKLIVDGLWSYVCPDLYAFCEWLFLGEDEPEGLIPRGEIFNNYYCQDEYKDVEETCCIRYPHLSDCEHGVRKISCNKKCAKWFSGYDTVVSCHDLLSKTLQNDWDGDHICLIHDLAFLDILNKKSKPLYYEMTKALPAEISAQNEMLCLKSSFGNENIGYVSNSITKLFNAEGEPDIDMIRVLTAYNNYVIDYFKTQKMMNLQNYRKSYEELKSQNSLPPYFFHYAKKKKMKNCQPYNPKNNVDRISEYVSKVTRKGITATIYTKDIPRKEEFNPNVLMNQDIKVNRQSDTYNELKTLISTLKHDKKIIAQKDFAGEVSDKVGARLSVNIIFNYYCSSQINRLFDDRETAATYCTDIEYYQGEFQNQRKDILWDCYGDILYKNICTNKDAKIKKKRRNVYTSVDKLQQEIENAVNEALEERRELFEISITKAVYDEIERVYTRKTRPNDKIYRIHSICSDRAI
ncbi:MAG: hypothetical protein LUF92_03700 [Clostridiales bacterium]|nr:hypothetical protein [Clostridiales bacterium]